jgi:serine/threonine protein kinase
MKTREVFKQGGFFMTYEILQLVGQGGFADIYHVRDRKNDRYCILKVERIDSPQPRFEIERKLYESVQYSNFFPGYFGSGQTTQYRFLSIEALGPSLSAIQRVLPGEKFSLSTGLHMATWMLRIIEAFHKAGHVVRDVKPANFLVRPSRAVPIAMIDFGLAKRHLDPNNSLPLPARRHGPFVGTSKYASIDAHAGRELGRRDDLIRWFYSIIEMLKGELPWSGMKDRNEIGKAKVADGVLETLCEGLPDEIPAIWRCLRQYGHYDGPHYSLLMAFVVQAMKSTKCKFEDPFDWESQLEEPVVSRISVIPLTIPVDEKPTIPTGLPPAIVPGEEPPSSEQCCSIQ